MTSLRIAIIAGHSSTTAGKRTPPFFNPIDIDGDGSYDIQVGEQYREHYANVGVALKFDEALRRCGFETVKIGWDDADATNDTLNDDSAGLAKRQSLVKANGCDYSVSIHFNACGDGATFNTATGICTYYHNIPSRAGDSALLASFIQGQIINGAKQYNRGIYSAGFAEVNCQAMGVKAAVLVELAFMTNQVEAETMMANEQYWIESAEEICKALCSYTGVQYIQREDEDNMVRYEKLENIPNDYGFRDVIGRLMDAQILKGDGSDPTGNNDVIDLSHDQVRTLVLEYRCGAFDRKLISMGMDPVITI